MCCASCKLALEGVVSEVFELCNKDPIVRPLTLGHGGRVKAFPLPIVGAPSPPPRALPYPGRAGTLSVFPSPEARSP